MVKETQQSVVKYVAQHLSRQEMVAHRLELRQTHSHSGQLFQELCQSCLPFSTFQPSSEQREQCALCDLILLKYIKI